MRKLLLSTFCLLLLMAVGCTSDEDKSEKSNPAPANVPVPPVTPAPGINLSAIQGSCKIGKVGPEDSAAGTVKIDAPKTGDFMACGVLPPNPQGFVAFQARMLSNEKALPTLRVIAPGQVGTNECVTARPTGVNYLPDANDQNGIVYVTKGSSNSTCKIETTAYDGHHWKGKLTANLLPAKPDQGSTIMPVKAEWDLYF